MDATSDSKENGPPGAQDTTLIGSIKAALRKAMTGQREVVLLNEMPSSAGSRGAGKIDALLEAFRDRATSQAPGKIIIMIDEIHGTLEQTRKGKAVTDSDLEKCLKQWPGSEDDGPSLPTPQQIGEMVAQEFHAGATGKVTCMKPLRLKTGFCAFR